MARAVTPVAGAAGPVGHESHRIVFLRQLPFTIVAAAVVAALVTSDPEALGEPLVLSAIGIALLTSVASIVVPWHRFDRRWSAVIPVADMLAIALAFTTGLDVVAGLALPVLWLSRVHGGVGMGAAVAGAAVISWLPQLMGDPITDGSLPRLIVEPAVFGAIGVYLHLAERRSRARQQLLQRQSRVLQRTLAEARRQQQLLEGVLNTIEVGVLAVDSDRRVVLRNRAQGDLAPITPEVGASVDGYAPAPAYAADRHTLLGPEASPLLRASAGERIEAELMWWPVDDERWRALRTSSSPLLDEHGNWDGAVVVYQDLTTEMAAMAQQNDFVASVSHDLRTPLTSILGFAEVLAGDPGLDEVQRRQVHIIERNARRLLGLIGDLLTAEQIERGALHLDLGDVHLGALVRDAVEGHGPHAQERGVTLRQRVEAPLTVQGDAARLAQVFDNVLSNAIKYSREGGRVTVSGGREDGSVVLRVRDDGIGIAPADQAKIFHRFYRAEAVRGGTVQGTGLGLHITRRLVEAHGGRVELDSEPGVGTEVRIILPEAP